MIRQRVLIVFVSFLFALISGCETVHTTQPGAVGIDREQHMLVSSEQVDKAAAEAYQQELTKARSQGKLDKSQAELARVRAVSDRLIRQVGVFREDATKWDWEINVESTKEMNAYCMPGGKIMVYTGLIDKLNLTDDELAAVIGHEMSHALREHSRERMSQEYAQQLVLLGAATVAGVSGSTVDLVNQVATVTFQLPHSREQESEADIMGLELMARAGYNPQSAITLWQKMNKASQGGPPEFLSTHPSGSNRIEDLQKNLPRVMPLYNAARHA
jgi:Zn-dependent protease with chaperone function